MSICKNQLEILRDILNEWDDETLMQSVSLSFHDPSRTVTIEIWDCDDEDFGELKAQKS